MRGNNWTLQGRSGGKSYKKEETTGGEGVCRVGGWERFNRSTTNVKSGAERRREKLQEKLYRRRFGEKKKERDLKSGEISGALNALIMLVGTQKGY